MPPKKDQPQKKDQQQQQQKKAPAKRNNRKKGAQKVDADKTQQPQQPQQTQPNQQNQAQQKDVKNKSQQPQKQNNTSQAVKKRRGGAAKTGATASGDNTRGVTAGGPSSSSDANRSKARLELIIRSKFQNPDKDAPSALESTLCQYLVDLEASNKDLKPALRDLGIVASREIQITPAKKAIVIFVPYIQHTRWQKIQDRVVRELEKKFSGQEVVFVAQRKVVKLNQIKNNIPRDRNMTITSVHENLLNDIVYPTKIVGKRTRFRVGGKRILKVYLDPKDSKDIEPRLSTYEVIYNKLTKKTVKFMFPRYII